MYRSDSPKSPCSRERHRKHSARTRPLGETGETTLSTNGLKTSPIWYSWSRRQRGREEKMSKSHESSFSSSVIASSISASSLSSIVMNLTSRKSCDGKSARRYVILFLLQNSVTSFILEWRRLRQDLRFPRWLAVIMSSCSMCQNVDCWSS